LDKEELFEVFTISNSMMGLGTKRNNKCLCVQPSGLILIKGTPYEKIQKINLMEIYQILVDNTKNKNGWKISLTFMVTFFDQAIIVGYISSGLILRERGNLFSFSLCM